MPRETLLLPHLDFAHDDLPDLHAILDQLRMYGPIVPVRFHDSRAWLILDHALLRDAFEDYLHFDPAEGYALIAGPAMGRTIQTMSGHEHRIHRALVLPPFLPARIRSLVETEIAPAAHRLLDRIEDEHEVDFVAAFARPYPFQIITRLLGIPVDDEQRMLQWAQKLIDFPWDPHGATAARTAFEAYMQRIINDRRRNPANDIVSLLVQAEQEGERLADDRILPFLALLFPAGSDTTYKNAGSLFAAVLADPALRAMAAGSDKDRALLVNEGLRWEAPTALLPRMASADVTLGDVAISKGDWMLFGITAANRDPAVYADPHRFDPARDQRDLLTFGRSSHFCIGMHLARRELETALRVVFERFPAIRLKPGEPVEFAGGVIRGPRRLIVQLHGAAP